MFLSSCSSSKAYYIVELCECSSSTTRQYLHYYDEYGITSIEDEFFTLEENYYIYLYSIACSYCEAIRECVFDYLDKTIEGDSLLNLYLLDKNRFENISDIFYLPSSEKNRDEIIKNSIGASDLYEVPYWGTPTLYKINNAQIENILVGKSDVETHLRKLLT